MNFTPVFIMASKWSGILIGDSGEGNVSELSLDGEEVATGTQSCGTGLDEGDDKSFGGDGGLTLSFCGFSFDAGLV